MAIRPSIQSEESNPRAVSEEISPGFSEPPSAPPMDDDELEAEMEEEAKISPNLVKGAMQILWPSPLA